MTPGQLLFSFLIAALITGVFAGFFRKAGPWKGFWIFFLIIFFVALAASQWVTPIGSSVYGYYWVPGLFVAIIFALLIAAVTPKGSNQRGRNRSEATKDTAADKGRNEEEIYQGDEPANRVAIGGFFWVFIILLIIAVFFGAIIDKTYHEVIFIK